MFDEDGRDGQLGVVERLVELGGDINWVSTWDQHTPLDAATREGHDTVATACQYADRVAAIGAVAGLRDVPDCDPARPVPIIAFHGTEDEIVEYDGGMGPKAAALPAPDGSGKTLGENPGANGAIAPGSMDQAVPDILTAWADRNGCSGDPTDTEASSDTTRIGYTCPAGVDVELYRSEGAGHDWPGSEMSASIGSIIGKTTFTIDATELIWAFFEQHPLP